MNLIIVSSKLSKNKNYNLKKVDVNLFINRARLINEAKRAREEMSYDLMSLEESMKSFQNEDEDKAKRKVI